MTGTTSPSPLIDRYIYDVVRRLPKDQRKDIELELRALIDDMLGGAAEESEVAGVLQNLGKPADLARRYRESEPCVVGPENYETYRLVLKIVLICVGVGIAVSAAVGWRANGTVGSLTDGIRLVSETLADGVLSLVAAYGFVTLIFAVLDRRKVRIEQKDAVWNPFSLPPVPDRRALIKRSDSVVGIVFMLIFGGLLIFAPQVFGAWVKEGEEIRAIPLFNLDIWHITMPLMLLGLGIALVEEITKLITGRYTLAVALFNAVSGLANLFIAVILLKFLPFLNPDFAGDLRAAYGWSSFSPGDLLSHWDTALIPNILLAVITAATLIDIGVTTYRAVRYSESAL